MKKGNFKNESKKFRESKKKLFCRRKKKLLNLMKVCKNYLRNKNLLKLVNKKSKIKIIEKIK